MYVSLIKQDLIQIQEEYISLRCVSGRPPGTCFHGSYPVLPQDDKCFYKSIFRFSEPQYLNSAGKQELFRVLHSLFASEIASSYIGKITGMPGYLNMDLPLVSLVQCSVSRLPDSQRSRTRLNIENYVYRDVKDFFQDVLWASDAEPDACLSVCCVLRARSGEG